MKKKFKGKYFLKFKDDIDFIPLSSNELLIRDETGKIIKIKEEGIISIINKLKSTLLKRDYNTINELIKDLEGEFSKEEYRKITEFLISKRIILKIPPKKFLWIYENKKISESKMKLIKPQLNFFDAFTGKIQNQLLLDSSHVCIVNSGRIGSILALILTELGIGNLTIIDNFNLTSMDKIFTETNKSIAKIKKSTLSKRLNNITPEVNIKEMNINDITQLDAEKSYKLFSNIDFFVVSDEYFNVKFFRDINKYLYPINKKYMFVWLEKAYANIGPIILPKKTGCFECFLNWKISNVSNAEDYSCYINYMERNKKIHHSYLNSMLYIIAGIAANEVLKEITDFGGRNTLYNKIIRYDTISSKMDMIPFWKIPKCPICSKKVEIQKISNIR